jgi:hypothetical protein
MICRFVSAKESYYCLQIQRRGGTILKADHSHKIAKHLHQINGVKTFEGLHTILNELEEIRSQTLVQSTAHNQIRTSVCSMIQTMNV